MKFKIFIQIIFKQQKCQAFPLIQVNLQKNIKYSCMHSLRLTALIIFIKTNIKNINK